MKSDDIKEGKFFLIDGKVVTRSEVDEYFKKRGTIVRRFDIPATNPKEEHLGRNPVIYAWQTSRG